MNTLRTWIEIDKRALRRNVEQFLKLIPKKARLMAVVKSNAYGHGLVQVASLLAGVNSKKQVVSNSKGLTSYFSALTTRLWFGVDSIVEGLRLRKEGIQNPIFVLGATLHNRLAEAARENITISVSNFDSLRALAKEKVRPAFHVKCDTGMHRQGFLPEETPQLIKLIKLFKLTPEGIFTHFAAAKDILYPTYTREQTRKFKEVVRALEKAGFKKLIRHAAASGGALLFPETHFDMVRIGMGLYGYPPSPEAGIRNYELGITLKPVLTWKTVVAEIKEIPKGSYVGYDLTERVARKTKIAVLPIGYWHGYDRGLSIIGEVLVRGARTKVLGRVSMDMIVVDVTDIDNKIKDKGQRIKVGEEVVLIGRQGKEAIWADELAGKIGTSQYEFLTRVNPLIKRIIK